MMPRMKEKMAQNLSNPFIGGFSVTMQGTRNTFASAFLLPLAQLKVILETQLCNCPPTGATLDNTFGSATSRWIENRTAVLTRNHPQNDSEYGFGFVCALARSQRLSLAFLQNRQDLERFLLRSPGMTRVPDQPSGRSRSPVPRVSRIWGVPRRGAA